MGVFKKEKEYSKSVDVDKLASMMENYLTEDKWKVQTCKTNRGAVIQATKGGVLRSIIAADRSLNILLSKTPGGLKATIGVGKWLQNIAVTAAEAAILSELFLPVNIPVMLWNAEIQNKVVKKMDEFVAQL